MMVFAVLLSGISLALSTVGGILIVCAIGVGIYWLLFKSVITGLVIIGGSTVVGWTLPLVSSSLLKIADMIVVQLAARSKVQTFESEGDAAFGSSYYSSGEDDDVVISSQFSSGRYSVVYPVPVEQRVRGETVTHNQKYALLFDDLDAAKSIALTKKIGGTAVELTDTKTGVSITFDSR